MQNWASCIAWSMQHHHATPSCNTVMQHRLWCFEGSLGAETEGSHFSSCISFKCQSLPSATLMPAFSTLPLSLPFSPLSASPACSWPQPLFHTAPHLSPHLRHLEPCWLPKAFHLKFPEENLHKPSSYASGRPCAESSCAKTLESPCRSQMVLLFPCSALWKPGGRYPRNKQGGLYKSKQQRLG